MASPRYELWISVLVIWDARRGKVVAILDIGRWCPTSSVIDDILLLLFPLDLSDESPLLSAPPPAPDLFLATDAEVDVACGGGGGGVNDDR